MNQVFSIAIILLLINFQSGTSQSFKQDLEPSISAVGLVGKVDSIVVSKMNQYNIPGLSLGIVRNDSIIYTHGYGVRSIESGDLVTRSTIFHSASISKLFTATAIMKLIEENELTLDDKLVKLVPGLNYTDKRIEEISIGNLMNHTSGLPDIYNYNWGNNNISDNSLKEYILGVKLKLKSAPSSEYKYSNLAYDILGLVIEMVSGSTFDEYMKKNILDVSGMPSSDFRYFKIPDSLRSSPHTKSRSTGQVSIRETYPYTREHAPSSTLNSSANELSHWMISFLKTLENDDSKGSYQTMIQPSFGEDSRMGLGFQLYNVKAKKAIGHFGGDRGFRSFLMMIPEAKIGLVVLANCDYNEDFRQEILFPLAELMLSQEGLD